MLQKTNPVITLKANQYDNCAKLVEILDRQMAEGRPESDLDGWSNSCGTAFCLLGEYLKEDYIEFIGFNSLCHDFYDDNLEFEFGFDCFIWFAGSSESTRQERKVLILDHMNTLQEEMQAIAVGV